MKRLRRWWDALSDPEIDVRRRGARIGMGLYLAAAIVVALGVWFLPDDIDRGSVLALAAIAGVASVGILAIPWTRLPRAALLAVPIVGLMFLGLSGYVTSYQDVLFLALLPLPFVFIGLTQRAGLCLACAPAAVIAFGLATADGRPPLSVTRFSVVLGLAVVTGELLAAAMRSQEQSRAFLGRLLDAAHTLARALDEADAVDLLSALTRDLLDADAVAVLLAEEPGSHVLVYANARTDVHRSPEAQLALPRPGSTAEPDSVVFVADARSSDLVGDELVFRMQCVSVAYIPLPGEREQLGAIVVGWRRRRRGLDREEERAARLLLAEAGHTLERVRRTQRLAREAETDPLTSLANRRRYAKALRDLQVGDAVVLLDVDHFKAVNDERGHAAGDELLRQLARHLRAVARRTDCVARYGGDELAVILCGVDVDGARAAVARLRASWAAVEPAATFSIGIAIHGPGLIPAATLGRADAALYRAKALGRDRVEIAPPPGRELLRDAGA